MSDDSGSAAPDATGHERRIEEKNIEMARMNAELVRANAELRRASELKSRFLSIASHELKTPLTLIKGYADMLVDTMRERLDEDVLGMVSSISRASERLHRVINNILDATRIERGRLRLSLEEYGIGETVEESVEEFRGLARQRDIALETTVPEGIPVMVGDRQRMAHVLANLLSNALRFSPDHTTVRLSVGLEGAGRLHIAVEDEGMGVAREEQARVFTPFYEVGRLARHDDNEGKLVSGGTGLGLSIARGIVEKHGGKIWVESPLHRDCQYPGSRFHVEIPLRAESPMDQEGTSGAETIESDAPAAKPCRTIVVADADPSTAPRVAAAMGPEFEIVGVSDGGAAVAEMLARAPAMLLVERELPVLSGMQVCELLSRVERDTGLGPMAFHSAWAGEDVVRKCFAHGAEDYVVKPIGPSALRDRLLCLAVRGHTAEGLSGLL